MSRVTVWLDLTAAILFFLLLRLMAAVVLVLGLRSRVGLVDLVVALVKTAAQVVQETHRAHLLRKVLTVEMVGQPPAAVLLAAAELVRLDLMAGLVRLVATVETVHLRP
jgi:hypothetical protein